MASISTHILDASHGTPAAGIAVSLYQITANAETLIATALTDSNGRIASFGERELPPSHYQLVFAIGDYFPRSFYPIVRIDFTTLASENHYHVPLLISPFAYSTYRGS